MSSILSRSSFSPPLYLNYCSFAISLMSGRPPSHRLLFKQCLSIIGSLKVQILILESPFQLPHNRIVIRNVKDFNRALSSSAIGA